MSLVSPNSQCLEPSRTLLSQIDQVQDREHFVHFYDKDAHLAEGVSRYFALGVADLQTAILIATPEHTKLIDERLAESGVDVQAAKAAGLYHQFDAEETLSLFMRGGHPNAELFRTTVGKIIGDTSSRSTGIRAFGEMVAILWRRGQRDAALELEALWNNLGKIYDFSLYCAYPFDVATSTETAAHDICCKHTRTIGFAPVAA